MLIRHLFLGTVVGLSAGRGLQAQTSGADSARVESIERLFVIADTERTHARTLEIFVSDQIKLNPAVAPYADILRSFSAKYSSFAAIKPDLVRLYRETYSEAEIQELITFYQTEFGQRLLSTSASLAQRSSQAALERVREHLPELTAAIQAGARIVPPT